MSLCVILRCLNGAGHRVLWASEDAKVIVTECVLPVAIFIMGRMHFDSLFTIRYYIVGICVFLKNWTSS